jgi:hypothetical protein
MCGCTDSDSVCCLQVLNCLGNLSRQSNAQGYSATCEDGQRMTATLKIAARAATYVNRIQPWSFPPQVSGCTLNDLLNIELATLPFLDCLNLNVSHALQTLETYNGDQAPKLEAGKIIEDATIRAAMDCVYNPHISNSECMYLINLVSAKLDVMDGMDSVTKSALTDFPQACTCSRGITQSAAFKAVSYGCEARDNTLALLEALETSCKNEAAVNAAMTQGMQGCSDADMIRSELVGIQVMDCLGADGKAVLASTQALDAKRLNDVVACVAAPSYTNTNCLALIASLPAVASQYPNSLEALLISRMQTDGQNFCNCVDGAFKSAPAQAIRPQCSSAYGVLQFERNNKATCMLLSNVPASRWAASVGSVASSLRRT